MSEPTSELLMFQVGARTYAAMVDDVRRIGNVRGDGDEVLVVASALGEPLGRLRGVVVACGEMGERTLVVDQVLGVRAVAEANLRPLPAFAAACLRSSAVVGFAMLDEVPTLLIDLPALVREWGDVDTKPRKGGDDA